MAYTVSFPSIFKKFYLEAIYNFADSNNELFLTFDDGPFSDTTDFILSTLNNFNAKATFFCTGKSISNNEVLFSKIKQNGHSVGNHSYNHLNGWKTDNNLYYEDIDNADKIVKSKLFRPPYGKLSLKQYHNLKNNYKIILWDVLSGDYDKLTSSERCFKNVIKNAKSGSIIVFHENVKSVNNLKETLPRVLEYFSNLNFTFCSIPV